MSEGDTNGLAGADDHDDPAPGHDPAGARRPLRRPRRGDRGCSCWPPCAVSTCCSSGRRARRRPGSSTSSASWSARSSSATCSPGSPSRRSCSARSTSGVRGRHLPDQDREMLPEAEIVFLDEVFQGSSAILNTLLTLLNERRFNNGAEARTVPLISLYGATAAPPEDPALLPFSDRFLLRLELDPVGEDRLADLLDGRLGAGERAMGARSPARSPLVTPDELRELAAQVRHVELKPVMPGLPAAGQGAPGAGEHAVRPARGARPQARRGRVPAARGEIASAVDLWPLWHFWTDPGDAQLVQQAVTERIADDPSTPSRPGQDRGGNPGRWPVRGGPAELRPVRRHRGRGHGDPSARWAGSGVSCTPTIPARSPRRPPSTASSLKWRPLYPEERSCVTRARSPPAPPGRSPRRGAPRSSARRALSGTVTGRASLTQPLGSMLADPARRAFEQAVVADPRWQLDGGVRPRGPRRPGPLPARHRRAGDQRRAVGLRRGGGIGHAGLEGTVEGTVEATAEASYYDDGYGGRTRSRARREAQAAAEREADKKAQADAEKARRKAERKAEAAQAGDHSGVRPRRNVTRRPGSPPSASAAARS